MTHVGGRSQRGGVVRRVSAARAAAALSRAASSPRMRASSRARAACFVAAGALLVVWLAAGGARAAQVWAEVLRLRAFAPGVAGRLEAGPGGRVRLVAENLPRPDTLTPDARAYVVWATAGRIVRLGALRRDANGRGSFEFSHPPNLPRYSLVVTAELSTDAARPAGSPVLSTRAHEVDRAAFAAAARRAAAPPARTATRDRRATTGSTATTTRAASTTPDNTTTPGGAATPGAAALVTDLRSRICAGQVCGADGFRAEVSRALAGGDAASRSLLLVGARGARGWARVSNRGGTAYARVRFRRVPPPARFGARRHVLWAVTDAAGPVYVGSLPAAGLNRSPAFVRAEKIDDPNFRLLVTAEKTHPAARPAGPRVLLTNRGRRTARRPRKP